MGKEEEEEEISAFYLPIIIVVNSVNHNVLLVRHSVAATQRTHDKISSCSRYSVS